MKVRQVVLALALALAAPAVVWASNCPALMGQIDAKLKDASDLTPELMEKVKALRSEGQAHHEAGKHKESVAALEKALDLLEED